MQLQDGTGKSYWAKVDDFNRLSTYSTTINEIGYVSNRTYGAYSISTDNLTFNSLNEHPVLWLRNDNPNPNKRIAFSSIIYSYNGGNTNHNRVMIKRVYRNPPIPTANYSSIEPQNMNFGSLRTAELTVYGWDESASDGMTVDISGYHSFSTSTVQKGTLTLGDIEGVILDYNSSILFTFQPEEIGTYSISTKLFFSFSHCI